MLFDLLLYYFAKIEIDKFSCAVKTALTINTLFSKNKWKYLQILTNELTKIIMWIRNRYQLLLKKLFGYAF